MQNLNLEFGSNGVEPSGAAAFFGGFDGGDPYGPPPVTDCAYQNAASCPDCGNGMIRLGSCFSCPSCGFESCSV